MKNITIAAVLAFSFLGFVGTTQAQASGRAIRNKHFHFSLTVPGTTVDIRDKPSDKAGDYLFDTVANVIILINKTESRFRSVKDYIDCEKTQLEKELRICYDDSALHLLSCSNPVYYPDRSVLLRIEVSVLPGGFNECMIYFIHHRNKDIQFSFMFTKDRAAESINFVDAVMKSLLLD